MMRRDVPVAAASITVEAFRNSFPLGSATRVALTGANGIYAGIVPVASAYAGDVDRAEQIGTMAILQSTALLPGMHIGQAMNLFDTSEADDLAVVDPEGRVLGLLTENFVRKRYAEELERAQRELYGEDRRTRSPPSDDEIEP